MKRLMFVLALITALGVPAGDTGDYWWYYDTWGVRTEAEARAVARRFLSGGMVAIAVGDQVIRCRVDDWEVYESWLNRLWRKSDSPCPAGTTELKD